VKRITPRLHQAVIAVRGDRDADIDLNARRSG
jgi:hypothetical protein